MARSTAELRFKNHLTANELTQLMGAVFEYAASKGVKMQCSREKAVAHFVYCCRKETQDFNNWIGNPAGFAGLIQVGADMLIESNSKSRNSSWARQHPVSWTVFPRGLHDMYTLHNRKVAVAFHKSLAHSPHSIPETATDAQVSACVYLDTINFAYNIFTTYFGRVPNNREIYAFNCMGWPLCAAYAALYNGKKNAYCKGKYANLNSVSRAWNNFLASQSSQVKILLAGGLGNLSRDVA